MNKPKIVHVVNSGSIGGAEKFVEWFAANANTERYNYIFIFLYGGGPVAIRIKELGYKTYILNWKNGRSLKNRILLCKFLSLIKPDIIHVHDETPFLIPFLSIGCRATVISTQHGGWISLKHSLIYKIFYFLDDKFLKLVIANSNYTAEKYSKMYHRKKAKIKVVYIGIDLRGYTDLLKTGQKHERDVINICFIGRLEEYKGVLHLPILAKELIQNGLNKFKIVVVGDGSAKKQAQMAVQSLCLEEYFEWAGWKENIKATLKISDIFIFPSLCNEPWGLILLEALAAGLPVVSYVGGGANEILENAPNVALCRKNDIQDMARKIIDMAHKINEIDKLQGYEYVLKNFSIIKTISIIEEIYQGLLPIS